MIFKKTLPKITKQLFIELKKTGKTIYQISKETGLDQAVFSRVKNGKENLSMGMLTTICDHFKWDLEIITHKKLEKNKNNA